MLKSYHDGYHDEIGSLTRDDISDTFTASGESDLVFTTREILIFHRYKDKDKSLIMLLSL